MLYQEKKIETGFTYDVEDIFGKIHIESSTKLGPDLLDDLVVELIKQNTTAETISGEVKHSGGVVKYNYTRAPLWDESEDVVPTQDICTNIPTETEKQESWYLQILHSIYNLAWVRTTNWCMKFVAVFREAWKRAGK